MNQVRQWKPKKQHKNCRFVGANGATWNEYAGKSGAYVDAKTGNIVSTVPQWTSTSNTSSSSSSSGGSSSSSSGSKSSKSNSQAQSSIDSAYQAMLGGYLPYDDYAANVILNGGVPVPNPRVNCSSGSSSSSGALTDAEYLAIANQWGLPAGYGEFLLAAQGHRGHFVQRRRVHFSHERPGQRRDAELQPEDWGTQLHQLKEWGQDFYKGVKAIQTQYGLHVRLDALGYMLDYPNLSSHNEYMNLAQDIFKNSEKVVPDLVKGEVYYIRGNDLLRVNSKTGEFISLYPGANSQRVINAINALEK